MAFADQLNVFDTYKQRHSAGKQVRNEGKVLEFYIRKISSKLINLSNNSNNRNENPLKNIF